MKCVIIKNGITQEDIKYCSYDPNPRVVDSDTDGEIAILNYPNPFNPSTVIKYNVSELSDVNITVYDITGKDIINWKFDSVNPGNKQVQWSGLNENNIQVPAGTYFYSISITSIATGKTVTNTEKMLFLK